MRPGRVQQPTRNGYEFFSPALDSAPFAEKVVSTYRRDGFFELFGPLEFLSSHPRKRRLLREAEQVNIARVFPSVSRDRPRECTRISTRIFSAFLFVLARECASARPHECRARVFSRVPHACLCLRANIRIPARVNFYARFFRVLHACLCVCANLRVSARACVSAIK